MPDDYLPPLRFHWLTRFYDPLMERFFADRRRKTRFLSALAPLPGERILDLGCGTARLAAAMEADAVRRRLVGIDRDLGSVLEASRRLRRLALSVSLVVGDAACLPFSTESFDRVASTLVFHHLSTSRKRRALREILRVLRSRGSLLLLDFGRAASLLKRVAFASIRLFDGWRVTAANAAGDLPRLMVEAGFALVQEEYVDDTPFGTLRCYSAAREGEMETPGPMLVGDDQKVSVTPK